MEPSIWTSMFIELPPEDALPRMTDLGWRRFELSTEHIAVIRDDERPRQRAEAVRSLVGQLGIEMPQAHGHISADVASLDDARREADLQKALADLECCSWMGIGCMVLHPGGGGAKTAEDAQRQASLRIASFARLAARGEELSVAIAVENTMDGGSGYLGRRTYGAVIPELHELIETVGSPMLGICLDTSHANVQRLDVAQVVRECGDRLIATHISDNDGSGDQHRTPFAGKIQWPPVVRALRQVGYSGPFNLEIPGERGVPFEILDLRTRHALEVTRQLLSVT
ncbi:MAG: sugar phosphate isomerase/epimerase family protein [Armatimonadota bacterium]